MLGSLREIVFSVAKHEMDTGSHGIAMAELHLASKSKFYRLVGDTQVLLSRTWSGKYLRWKTLVNI